ncbi:LCR-like protein [Medicago truncatula]|uniref:LCR-like protein n=1 Tax=Medicago truncatula TaxID=3880 RepID=A0A072VPE3_MEDTR|nr:LCR-like protein [Medicago truncatula]
MKTLFCFSILLLVLSANFGNQMMMAEAETECLLYRPHFCRKWEVVICKLFCKFTCKNENATGKCHDDKSCNCNCCP